MRYQVYIPSKGRAKIGMTASLCISAGVPCSLVVEPQDREAYAGVFGEQQLIVLPENNRGIAFVRNFIKDFSRERDEAYHWQIDDNIKAFMVREYGKNLKRSADQVLPLVEEMVSRYSNIGIAGLTQTTFAWSAKSPVSINRQAYSCVLVNNVTRFRWRPDTCEDTDYSMQILVFGGCTMIFNTFLIDKMPSETLRGGNTEISYKDGGRERRVKNLLKAWPGAFTAGERYGKFATKPSRIWSKFMQRPISVHKPSEIV